MKFLKHIIPFLALLTCCFLLSACAQRHQYTQGDKKKTTTSMFSIRLVPPGLTTNVMLADLIVEGVIQSEGEEYTFNRILDETDMPEEFQLTGTATKYTLQVTEVWFGEQVPKEIEVSILGTRENSMQPLKGDHVVMFLHPPRTPDILSFEMYYNPVDGADSIVIINPPDDSLFVFSDMPEMTAFDGSETSVLKNAIRMKLGEFAESPTEFANLFGDIALAYTETTPEQELP